MKKRCVIALAILLCGSSASAQVDHTPLIQDFGSSPAYDKKGAYASNIWDLFSFEGLIYLGMGNSSNLPPNANAGPVPIVTFDPATDAFSTPFTVDEEQIDIYRLIQGQLVVPGHDPRGNPSEGNFYRLEQGQWVKYSTVPNGIHTYDMLSYKGDLYAALGAENDVVRSSDDGQTWSRVPMGVVPSRSNGQLYARSYVLFEFEGKLWSVGTLQREAGPPIDTAGRGLWSWDGSEAEEREDLPIDVMMPHVASFSPYTSLSRARPHRAVVFDGALYYLGANPINDHQVEPAGVYRARSLVRGALDIEVVRVDQAAAEPIWTSWRPWDLVARDGALYILASRAKKPEGSSVPQGFEIGVWASKEGDSWTRILKADLETFARSLEVQDGDLYLGLGTDVAKKDHFFSYTQRLLPDSGKLLRLRHGDWTLCGDGFLDPLALEQCDQGSKNADDLPDRCRRSCELPRCGDLIVDSGEACDGGPECTPSCALVAPPEEDMNQTTLEPVEELDMSQTALEPPEKPEMGQTALEPPDDLSDQDMSPSSLEPSKTPHVNDDSGCAIAQQTQPPSSPASAALILLGLLALCRRRKGVTARLSSNKPNGGLWFNTPLNRRAARRAQRG